MIKSNTRIEYLDIARGIAIILMIIGHTIPNNTLSYKLIYSFHMPLFIIISGYLYKEQNNINLIKKLSKKLIIPYIICLTITYIYPTIILKRFNIINLAYIILTQKVGYIWFLPFLIIISLIFNFIKTKTKKKEELLLSIIILSTTGIILNFNKIYLPLSIDMSLTCIFFYYIGYMLKKKNILKTIFNSKHLIIIISIIYIITINFGNIEIALRKYPYGPLCFIPAISGSLIILYISKIIEKLTIPKKILKWYGQNTIYILIIHQIESSTIFYDLININIPTKIVIKLIIITIITIYFLFLNQYIIIKKNKHS